jgi:CAAX prenyl protease-like protein
MTDNQKSILAYVAPFGVYLALLGIEHTFNLPVQYAYPVRCAVTLLVLLAFSRPAISLRPTAPVLSIALGIAVFLIWIGPDALFGTGYRHFWLFENSVTGKAATNIQSELRNNLWFLVIRAGGSALLVPIIEELFWRGFLMRWMINPDFCKVPLGTYAPMAFWVTAALFASEHGSYWEVGLAAGILYNWLVIRTRNLGDCILAHAVTNGLLAVYVIFGGYWQYWM